MNASKKKAENTGVQDSSRRDLLGKIWKGLGILAALEVFALLIAYLWPRKPEILAGRFGSVITAGPADSFALDSVTPFPQGQFYLSRLKDGGFLALSRKCTHLGCTVPWDEDKRMFICPCHSSEFDIAGDILTAPAPRPLDIYKIDIVNSIVHVDTGSRIKRSRFDISQAVKS